MEQVTIRNKKMPFALRVYGALNVVMGIITTPLLFLGVAGLTYAIINKDWATFNEVTASNQALVLSAVSVVILILQTVLFVIFGIRLFRNKRRGAGVIARILIFVTISQGVVLLMLTGYSLLLIVSFIEIIFLIVMYVTLDPALREERALQIRLRELENKADQEEGTLGRDKSGKRYLKLDFFNIFWLFMIAALFGFLMESVLCPFLNGRIENRTGVLYGCFSPIYGFGAILMLLPLNRLYNKNPILICLVSGLIGGAFEYAVSWFFQFAFGILAWSYSNELLNIDGRTDIAHIVAWGVLGLFFIKVIVPKALKIINLIPWNWRYTVTVIAATLMIINGGMTLMAFQCWFDRASGATPDTPVAQFYAEYYGDDFMKNRFQTMSIDPARATRPD